jgi:hypothetical protein
MGGAAGTHCWLLSCCPLHSVGCSSVPPRLLHARSYLGYGLMAGRAAVLSEGGGEGGHPCVPAGYAGPAYEYGGKTLEMKPQKVGVYGCVRLRGWGPVGAYERVLVLARGGTGCRAGQAASCSYR